MSGRAGLCGNPKSDIGNLGFSELVLQILQNLIAFRAAQGLEFGGVTVNEAPTFRSDQMPYGGVKDSGNTREGPRYAVREMTEERLVVVDLP